jgi:hypothetical protein
MLVFSQCAGRPGALNVVFDIIDGGIQGRSARVIEPENHSDRRRAP